MARPRPTAWDVSENNARTGGKQSVSLEKTVTASNSPFAGPVRKQPGSRSALPSSSARPSSRESSSRTSRPLTPLASSTPLRSSAVASTSRPHTPSGTAEKRKSRAVDRPSTSQPDKRRRVNGLGDAIEETESTVILGEDPREEFSPDEKPIRFLADFRIFDSRSEEDATLADLSVNDREKIGRYKAIGHVAPIYEEEEAGQDDDYLDVIEGEPQMLRTSPILSFSINYADANSPVYLETKFAWYMLGLPSDADHYKRKYMASFKPHRLAQLLISRAIDYPKEDMSMFKESYLGLRDHATQARIMESDFLDCGPIVRAALQDSTLSEAYRSPLIQQYTSSMPHIVPQQQSFRLRPISTPRTRTYTNNIDLEVLRPENQNQTYVTPLIDRLSRGLFREKLRVAGSPPKEIRLGNHQKRFLRERLLSRLRLANKLDKSVVFADSDRKCGEYWNAVTVEDTKCCVGDVILVTAGNWGGRQMHPIPDVLNGQTVPATRVLADYFWFGQLIWINQRTKKAHVHWMEHASKTVLQEIHDPQELFLVEMCDSVKLSLVVGKIDVQYMGDLTQEARLKARAQLNYKNYFYTYSYQQKFGTFLGIEPGVHHGPPPDNCTTCFKISQKDTDSYGRQIKRGGVTIGVAVHGHVYHVHDFAMFRQSSSEDLCLIGQILDIAFQDQSCELQMRVLGRVSDIRKVCPQELKDERHLFLTDKQQNVKLVHIVGPCQVLNANEVSSDKLQQWLSTSPRHLYVRYHFPDPQVKHMRERTILKGRHARMLEVCKSCYDEELYQEQLRHQYTSQHTDKWRLRAFDPFGGVGAFALSMQEAGCLQLTHAVEISPSAAKTLKKNSPQTVVYNQCANVMLEYAIKHDKQTAGSTSERTKVKTIYGSEDLPKPPRPQDIDCIVAGFPCQPHSRLNMFQKANDRKASLMLVLLSFVDFYKPKYCFFENVRGFLQFNLNAEQVDQHRVTGGIEMGGLKFLVHAMLSMGYQVRFGLLQAAHYGTPQARVRFFMVAAKLGLALPELPQPIYHFSVKDALKIKMPHQLILDPIDTTSGIALFNSVTVDDAISDLPRFDWRNPHKFEVSRQDPQTNTSIPAIDCNREKGFCGPRRIPYHHEPRTLFQKTVRQPRLLASQENIVDERAAGEDLQHFTRVLKDDVVARVVNIPLRANADYRALFSHEFRHLWEWQTSDPKSATARHGYRPGMYGRLDKDGYFRTTVTNVEPTAKQSWVLNPYCKRVVTVRELARSQGFPDWFKFYCVTSDVVKTMHREIGNAVPWPVGLALGRELKEAMFKHWFEHERGETEDIIE